MRITFYDHRSGKWTCWRTTRSVGNPYNSFEGVSAALRELREENETIAVMEDNCRQWWILIDDGGDVACIPAAALDLHSSPFVAQAVAELKRVEIKELGR